jgi:hypothetical protein
MDVTGRILLLSNAGAAHETLYSIDQGAHWIGSGILENYGWCTISANGLVFYATNQAAHGIIQSVDQGAHWATLANSPTVAGGNICTNFDGSIALTAYRNKRAYVSTDSGVSWPEVQPNGNADFAWCGCAMDYSGAKQYIIYNPGRIYRSTGTGATGTWTETQPNGNASFNWTSIFCSWNGSTVFAQASASRLWVSIDSGVTWAETRPVSDSNQYWGNFGFVSPYGEAFGAVLTPPVNPTKVYLSNYRENIAALFIA